MPLAGNLESLTYIQMCQVNKITSGFIHALDGSLLGSKHCKHSHISEPEDVEEELVSKRHHKLILSHS